MHALKNGQTSITRTLTKALGVLSILSENGLIDGCIRPEFFIS